MTQTFNNQTHKQLNIMLAKAEQYTILLLLNHKFIMYGTEIPGPHRPWAQSQLYGAEIPSPGPGPIPALGAGPVERSSYLEPFSRLP